MSNKADEVILKINKLISERIARYVGRTTVTDLMAIARRIAGPAIILVFREEGLDSVALGKLPEGEVFQVEQGESDPTEVRVLLQEVVRASVDREIEAGLRRIVAPVEKPDNA